MVFVYQDASLGGTGAAELIASNGDSATLVDRNDTLSFNGSKVNAPIDPNVIIDDAGSTTALTSAFTINGTSVAQNARVEFNYSLIAEDTSTGLWYRVSILAFGNDGNKGYIVSRGWDPVTQSYTNIPYSGQALRVMEMVDITNPANNVAGVSIAANDPELNAFALGDGSLTLTPQNNDGAGATAGDLAACFTRGTLIKTQAGDVPIEDLRQGDLVLTRDNGYQPIRWVGRSRLDSATLERKPNLRPIRIGAGSLGQGLPSMELVVSPQHRVLVASSLAQRMFGEREVLMAAKHLTALEGIDVAEDLAEVEYWHFLLDQHHVVISNGAATESLYTGPEALKSVSAEARDEILDVFPHLADVDHDELPDPARLLVPGRQARNFAARAARNRVQLVA